MRTRPPAIGSSCGLPAVLGCAGLTLGPDRGKMDLTVHSSHASLVLGWTGRSTTPLRRDGSTNLNFRASDHASHLNGAVVPVDGGRVAVDRLFDGAPAARSDPARAQRRSSDGSSLSPCP